MPATEGLPDIPVIWNFDISIEKYESLGKNLPTPSLEACPHCQASVGFLRHGFYQRYVIVPGRAVRLFILRLKCCGCLRTTGILPHFVPAHRQASWAVLWSFLWWRYVLRQPLRASLEEALGRKDRLYHSQGREWGSWIQTWWGKLGLALAETVSSVSVPWQGLPSGCSVILRSFPNFDSALEDAVLVWVRFIRRKRALSLWVPALGNAPPLATK